MMFEELKKIVCDEIEHTLSNIEKEEIDRYKISEAVMHDQIKILPLKRF